MRLLVAAFVVLASTLLASAEPPETKPAPAPSSRSVPAVTSSSVAAAIDRGVAFLIKDAQAWKARHNCVSCHHAALTIWSLQEAKQRGHAVDEPYLAELTKWVAESGDGKTGVPRPKSAPNGLNTKAMYFALALGTDPQPDPVTQTGLKRMLGTVNSDQNPDGTWTAWPATRPPIFGDTTETATVQETLALLPLASAGDDAAKAAFDNGVRWLSASKPGNDPRSLALRLVLWRRIKRPNSEWKPLLEQIKQSQKPDGGWSQAPEMPSDAWATGQSLYALAHADLPATDPAIARGQQFLVRTQRDDGSWPMTSRPIEPGGKGSTSLIPITGAGSAWAVIGLARSR
jgi:hypothetical protein